jgi:hypothetical protein
VIIFLTFISLILANQLVTEKSEMINREDEEVAKQLVDLNQKLDASETVLINLLNHEVIKESKNLQEHVEKLLDYLRFRKNGINNWNINYNQFKKMKTRINKDYIALPYKIVDILSDASKNRIIHIVPNS